MNIKKGLTLVAILSCSCAMHAQQESKQIDVSNICIDVNYMIPLRYPSRTVNDFSLSLKGDTVISQLPYMGQAHYATYGDTDGLNFKQPITDKTIKLGKKGRTTIKFSCKNSSSTYDFSIEVYPDGAAYINLIPSHADRISYKGEWSSSITE